MKFKAYKEQKGTYFVNTHKVKGSQKGRRFESKLEAEQFALMETMQYHQNKLDAAWFALKDSAISLNSMDEPMLEGFEHYTSKGDLLC